MRIISGKYRGRSIRPPKGLPVRPTTDRTKESLFNILTNYFDLEGLKVLDLFSGTGNISLEFVSRGVQRVVAVDAHYGCLNFLKKQLRELQFTNFQTIKRDVKKYVASTTDRFDIIFMDPPYAMDGQEAVIDTIINRDLLLPNGMLIVEHYHLKDFSKCPGFLFSRKYGDSSISLFSPEESRNT